MTLLFDGKTFAETLRSDISLGKVAPQIGTTLMLVAALDPNTTYSGTNRVHDSSGDETIVGVALKKWIRFG
jgi:hypothetical protein